METHFVPYRYHTYTDTLIAIGTAAIAEHLFGLDAEDVVIRAGPDGFRISHPDRGELHDASPLFEVKDKAEREIKTAIVRDRTPFGQKDAKPSWWGTTSTINTLATPAFNNSIAQAYNAQLGASLLGGSADAKQGSQSQLLYAHASKGVNGARGGTAQGNVQAASEQIVAHTGYQHGAAGFLRDPYTVSFVPRPHEISLHALRAMVDGFLRGYLPKSSNDKILPTRDQTVPFFVAMAYFDFIVQLFDYRDQQEELSDGAFGEEMAVGRIVSALDRAMYVSMGTSSAPYVIDSLVIPDWLDQKSVAVNVRDVVRNTLGAHLDPNLLYLPVRAFAERDPRPLLRFYRLYDPVGGKKKLLTQDTLHYVMEKTGYATLTCDAMQHFARALRSRTLTRLYKGGEPPDFELLTDLKSASLDNRGLVNMLSAFVGSYNLRNARLSADGKKREGANLSYDDLQEIIGLIEHYGAEFVANTLMAQAMSKRSDDPADEGSDSDDASDTED